MFIEASHTAAPRQHLCYYLPHGGLEYPNLRVVACYNDDCLRLSRVLICRFIAVGSSSAGMLLWTNHGSAEYLKWSEHQSVSDRQVLPECVHIQVVCGLIQQQQVAALLQHARQVQPVALTTCSRSTGRPVQRQFSTADAAHVFSFQSQATSSTQYSVTRRTPGGPPARASIPDVQCVCSWCIEF